MSDLDKAWAAVNALGGTFYPLDAGSRGYKRALDDAIAAIERLGGRDQQMRKTPVQYRSKTVEQALAHLVEELSEAATAGAKSLRWGLDSCNPELPEAEHETNLAWLRREMDDVNNAYSEFLYMHHELSEPTP